MIDEETGENIREMGYETGSSREETRRKADMRRGWDTKNGIGET